MDKVLAFSILSASPADIAAGAGSFSTRFSWRRGAGAAAGGHHQQQHDEPAEARQQQRDKERPQGHGGDNGKQPPAFLPRFAPEFDGIDCFETIVSH